MLHIFLTALFWIYWCVTVFCALLFLRALFRESDWKLQMTAALALIPLVLRALLLK
jgi:hypothetical protein